jgi:2-polyprenyl-6-methoxyphenol hydroxylase-like FAD-dependent oxidoreductase
MTTAQEFDFKFTSTPNAKPKVLIIGAGIGGLVLAQVLRKHGISYRIFERDSGLISRTQGWAINIDT